MLGDFPEKSAWPHSKHRYTAVCVLVDAGKTAIDSVGKGRYLGSERNAVESNAQGRAARCCSHGEIVWIQRNGSCGRSGSGGAPEQFSVYLELAIVRM